MDYAFVHVKKDLYQNKTIESSENIFLSQRSGVKVKLKDLSFLVIAKPNLRHFCEQKFSIQHIYYLHEKISKQITNLEEKFILYSIESIHKCIKRKFMEYYQGMLHCSWKDGYPRYIFSADDNREFFIMTDFIKVESINDKGEDCVYTFHSNESDLLGRMSVSTSLELCPHGTQIMETKFVLCANVYNNNKQYTHSLDQTREKNKGLSKNCKSHSYNRTFSAMQGNLLDPKIELAAIVIKDHIRESQKELEIGGWGLKFLRKDRQCESCKQKSSMNVVVPAGFHGGPRTRNGGAPSSLVDRWRNGGSCDCGGWDLGCPLTVLHAGSYDQDGVFELSVSFDLFAQSSKQTVPVLRMLKVRDGLYDLRFKSTLSPMQSLSIAVAAIHSRSPILRHILYAN